MTYNYIHLINRELCAENLIFLFKVMEYKVRFASYLVDGIETDEEYSDIFGYRIKFPKKLFTLSNAKQRYIESQNLTDSKATKSLKSLSPPSKDLDPSLLYKDIVSKSGSGSNDNGTSPRTGTALDLVPTTVMKPRQSITATVTMDVHEPNTNYLSTSFGFESALQQQQSMNDDDMVPSTLPKPPGLKKTITLSDILNGTASVPSVSMSRSRYSQSERVDAHNGHNPKQISHSGLAGPHGLQLCMFVFSLSLITPYSE